MRHQNITLSFPSDLNALLHMKVSGRGISKYVAKAVRKALEEDESKEQMELEAAYEEANKDRDRLEVIKDWKTLDDVTDVRNWEWDEG